MKRSELSLIYSLLIIFALFISFSCNDDEGEPSDLYSITTDIRLKVKEGVKAIDTEQKELFYARLDSLVEVCNSPVLTRTSSIQPYFETKEYIEFKEHIISIAPESYYLLIEVFLKGEVAIGPFSYMFKDIVEATYPGLINQVLDQLENASMEQFVNAYPQVCVEHLLRAMEATKK